MLNKKKENAFIKNKKFESVLDSIILSYFQQDLKKSNGSFKEFICFLEKKIIYSALEVTNGNQRIASEILGIKKTTLNEKMKKLGVCRDDFNFNLLNILEKKMNIIEKAI